MELQVSVQIEGQDVACGTLYTNVRRGRQSASFRYDPSYLVRPDAFALSPDLPLGEASIHTIGDALFRAFEDCMPDRWGRTLMLRAERNAARNEQRAARTLFEGDFLAGVSDHTRQGALRVWADGQSVAPLGKGVPHEVDIPTLLSQADMAAKDMDAEVRDLLEAGSSLGGARPKASVVNERGRLCIAKFPKESETLAEDVCAWEHVALTLAQRCGIGVPHSQLIRIGGRAVLLVERFDRLGEKRTPYLSGMSAIQGSDGGDYSYLELVDFLESEGSRPAEDIRRLWRRVLFSCAIGNVDDHMRNHAFLRERTGWALSPAFDINPTSGDGEKYLSCAIDFDERLAVPSSAMAVCEEYRVSPREARQAAWEMSRELAAWRRIAAADGISHQSVALMESCFESGIERLARIA